MDLVSTLRHAEDWEGDEDGMRSKQQRYRRPPRLPSVPDLFSPVPPGQLPSHGPPSASTPSQTATSAAGELTPPASPTPPSVLLDPEPVTPRKQPPRPSVFPHFPQPSIRSPLPSQQQEGVNSSTYGGSSRPTSLLDTASFPLPPSAEADTSADGSFSEPSRWISSASASAVAAPQRNTVAVYSLPNVPLAHLPRPPGEPSPPRTSDRPHIQLLRTSTSPIHAGTTFPLALRAFNFLPSTHAPLPVTLVFSCMSGTILAADKSLSPPHQLFRLEAQVALASAMWTGSITVPFVARCETCGSVSSTPWSSCHRDEGSGTIYETLFLLEAKAGEQRARLEVEVLPEPWVPVPGVWAELGMAAQVAASGWIGLQLETVKFSIQVYPEAPRLPSPAATDDLPLLFDAALSFRQPSHASTTDLASLLPLFLPRNTSVTLLAVLTTPDGAVLPLGGTWSSSSSSKVFYLEVDSSAESVRARLRLPLTSKAVVCASSTSCAGFAIGFRLRLDINQPAPFSTSPLNLRAELPFLPPRPPSASAFPGNLSVPAAQQRVLLTAEPTAAASEEPARGAGEKGRVKRAWRRLKEAGRALLRGA